MVKYKPKIQSSHNVTLSSLSHVIMMNIIFFYTLVTFFDDQSKSFKRINPELGGLDFLISKKLILVIENILSCSVTNQSYYRITLPILLKGSCNFCIIVTLNCIFSHAYITFDTWSNLSNYCTAFCLALF